jgi:hypothetical protein
MNLPTSLFFACFFCGVDSRALLYFVLVFVLSIVLASVTFLIWSISKGDFRSIEGPKYDMFNDPEAGIAGTIATPPAHDPMSDEDRNT